jgi:cytoskeletal protein CcmA (bactofilin family)
MWNKTSTSEPATPATRPASQSTNASTSTTSTSSTSPSSSASATHPQTQTTGPARSRIGAGTNVKGTLQGREDLIVEGRIEGRVELQSSSVSIEESGRVEGDVLARTIKLSGEVHGNLTAEEDAVLLHTARLVGNIVAKRVTIEAGARFRGSIDMETGGARERVSPIPSVRDTAESGGAVVSKPNGSTERLGMG